MAACLEPQAAPFVGHEQELAGLLGQLAAAGLSREQLADRLMLYAFFVTETAALIEGLTGALSAPEPWCTP